jgi:hypothetical protein
MKKAISACALVVIGIFALVSATQAQEQKAPSEKSDNSVEEKAYKNVNSFDPQSLRAFLNGFPSGKHSQDAKTALELLDRVQNIKKGKIAADYVIPFENIGGADGWAGPGRIGFTGYTAGKGRGHITRGVFLGPFNGGETPGRGLISFDSQGNLRVADTDGSIIGFITNGIDYGYYGGVKFKTPGDAPAYFGVIKGKGFVHLKGAVSVTVKGKATVNLK